MKYIFVVIAIILMTGCTSYGEFTRALKKDGASDECVEKIKALDDGTYISTDEVILGFAHVSDCMLEKRIEKLENEN